MTLLSKHGEKLESVFELLGRSENDITFSLGWVLSRCPRFLQRVLNEVLPGATGNEEAREVLLQEFRPGQGYTDVEVAGPDFHIVLEAKRGWNPAGQEQLAKYAGRMYKDRRTALVSVSECPPWYARMVLPQSIGGVPVKHLRWSKVVALCEGPEGTHAEKRWMRELRTYLQRSVRMRQDQTSNWVFVVALKAEQITETLSWIDIVAKKRRYFHPAPGNKDAKRWPKEPPNYIGFRYYGKLQSVHHVDSWQVVEDWRNFPELAAAWGGMEELHFEYSLGPPIRPGKDVRSGGSLRARHVWAMIDLLLTCDTIIEAEKLSKKREREDSEGT